jgi:hypothetical protein
MFINADFAAFVVFVPAHALAHAFWVVAGQISLGGEVGVCWTVAR